MKIRCRKKTEPQYQVDFIEQNFFWVRQSEEQRMGGEDSMHEIETFHKEILYPDTLFPCHQQCFL